MSKQDVCQQVLHHASRWADGNLGAATSDAIKTHLARCDGCRIEFAAIRELSRLVRAQAPDGLPDGFAARVRETAVQAGPARPQGRWWRHVAMRRAAAALLVVIGLGWAYHLGREHGSATTSGPGVQPDVPVNVVSFDSPTHLRAARSVASDLGIIDRIPERLRRPLLRAQIDHFELDRWAEEVRRHERAQPTVVELAALIRELSQTLEDPRSGGNILQLRQRALQPNLWSPIPGMMVSVDIDVSSNARKRRHRSVRSAAPDMPEGIHIALGRVLELKEHLADGNPWPFITMQHGEADVSGELRPSIEVALAATLGEAGLDELAVPWLRPLREGSPDVFRVLTSTFFTGKDPLRIELGSIGNLQDRLEKLLRRTRGSGEIVIQETTDDEGFVFKVLFRSESRKKRER